MTRIIPVKLQEASLPLPPAALTAKDMERLKSLVAELAASGLLDPSDGAAFESAPLEEVQRLFDEAAAVAHSEREDNPAYYNPAEEERLRRLGQGRETSFEARLQDLHENY